MTRASNSFSERLLNWFDQHGRKDLPWQQNKTPYRVWVSEIMLQQTQVSAVIAYYQRFMQRFPTLADLAEAEQDAVLEHWAGLGYYARARNLHKCAQIVHEEYAGKFPDSLAGLTALPGIGRSTAGAILSIAMALRGVILDGNVKRVLCRYKAIEGWPGKHEIEQQLWHLAESYTPTTRVDDYTQAIMDLGAT
ncbi:MAG: A/G-specific adenine glycosylase, partial [Oleiphilaceae bacterium]|nr:A/G-specific adenine glycosylase [Oleiphilaceae bacterium]